VALAAKPAQVCRMFGHCNWNDLACFRHSGVSPPLRAAKMRFPAAVDPTDARYGLETSFSCFPFLTAPSRWSFEAAAVVLRWTGVHSSSASSTSFHPNRALSLRSRKFGRETADDTW
jgi:hypothetical protein